MPNVDNHVQLNTRASTPGFGRRVAPNHRARAARRPNPLAVTPGRPAGPLAMRWSTGPDGRLCCAWILLDASGRTGCKPAANLAREPIRDAPAAY